MLSAFNPLDEHRGNGRAKARGDGEGGDPLPPPPTPASPTPAPRAAVNVTRGGVGKPRVAPGLTAACFADAARKSRSASVFPADGPWFCFCNFHSSQSPKAQNQLLQNQLLQQDGPPPPTRSLPTPLQPHTA